MIAMAVPPMARPIKKRRKSGVGTARWSGDAGCSRMVANVKAEIIKSPRQAPSIKYSGQWFFKTSDMGTASSGILLRLNGWMCTVQNEQRSSCDLTGYAFVPIRHSRMLLAGIQANSDWTPDLNVGRDWSRSHSGDCRERAYVN